MSIDSASKFAQLKIRQTIIYHFVTAVNCCLFLILFIHSLINETNALLQTRLSQYILFQCWRYFTFFKEEQKKMEKLKNLVSVVAGVKPNKPNLGVDPIAS